MAFVATQLQQVAAVDDDAAGNLVPVLPAPGAGVDDVNDGYARVSPDTSLIHVHVISG